jgi:hypothetical protein
VAADLQSAPMTADFKSAATLEVSMKARMFLALVGVALMAVLALRADEPQAKKADDANQIREDLTLREQILSRQFAEFEQSLLKLMQRLRASPKQDDRDRAVILQKALEKAKDVGVGTQFEQLVELLKIQQLKSVGDIRAAAERSGKIAENLREILDLLRQDTRTAKLREERLSLERLIKKLERVIHDQKVTELATRHNRTDKNELKTMQNRVTQKTTEIAKELGSKIGQGGEAKKADAKDAGKGEGKKGESKDAGSAKKGAGKDAGKGKEAKAGEAKAKSGDPKENKSGEAGKSGAAKKGGEAKQGDAKSGKGGDSKSDSKSGAGKPGKQGDAKSGSKSSGQGQSKSGGQKSGPQANKKDDQKAPPPQPQQPQPANNNGKKQVEDANYKQKDAEKAIEKGDNKDASDKETDALKKLEEARKKLEELLRQMREEELERLLANLQARCEKMLAMQMQVLAGTEGVSRSIESHKDKKAARRDQQDSLRLSDDEKEIVAEATKAIELLEAEGSAVAFPEVFKQVREDMKHVQRRLSIVDVSQVTQAIEKDIIDTLKEMIEALKKARQELDNKKSPPSQSGPPPDQKLLDKIAELKMILSMQIRVSTRTRIYGAQYQGEQAADPNISRELRNLSERQERIFEVTNRIAKGDNQ